MPFTLVSSKAHWIAFIRFSSLTSYWYGMVLAAHHWVQVRFRIDFRILKLYT